MSLPARRTSFARQPQRRGTAATLRRLGLAEGAAGAFEANTGQVMDLMVDSLYDTPEVFLRGCR